MMDRLVKTCDGQIIPESEYEKHKDIINKNCNKVVHAGQVRYVDGELKRYMGFGEWENINNG